MFVERNGENAIIGAFALRQPGRAEEEIAADAAELLTFLNPPNVAVYAAAIQAHVDATARTRGYANGVALASYVVSTVPAWAAEAQAFVAWRDAVWLYAHEALNAVATGQAEHPSVVEFVATLPEIGWPAA